MVPQDAFLFDTTIVDNVRFGRRDASDDEVRLAFTELGLDGWLDALADGMADRGGRAGRAPVGRRAPARGAGPGLRRQPVVPGARRGHQRRRRRHRGPPGPGAGEPVPRAARRSPSPTGCRRRPGPTGCSCSRTAGWSSRAPRRPACDRDGVYAGLHRELGRRHVGDASCSASSAPTARLRRYPSPSRAPPPGGARTGGSVARRARCAGGPRPRARARRRRRATPAAPAGPAATATS